MRGSLIALGQLVDRQRGTVRPWHLRPDRTVGQRAGLQRRQRRPGARGINHQIERAQWLGPSPRDPAFRAMDRGRRHRSTGHHRNPGRPRRIPQHGEQRGAVQRQTRRGRAVGHVQHDAPAVMAQHLADRGGKGARRTPRAQRVQHGKANRLHHQPRAEGLRRGKAFDHGDGMAAPRQQRRRRQPANPRAHNADPVCHGPFNRKPGLLQASGIPDFAFFAGKVRVAPAPGQRWREGTVQWTGFTCFGALPIWRFRSVS